MTGGGSGDYTVSQPGKGGLTDCVSVNLGSVKDSTWLTVVVSVQIKCCGPHFGQITGQLS